nr:MAG TPA: hypothetical protein [Caudoviricetes sp.]
MFPTSGNSYVHKCCCFVSKAKARILRVPRLGRSNARVICICKGNRKIHSIYAGSPADLCSISIAHIIGSAGIDRRSTRRALRAGSAGGTSGSRCAGGPLRPLWSSGSGFALGALRTGISFVALCAFQAGDPVRFAAGEPQLNSQCIGRLTIKGSGFLGLLHGIGGRIGRVGAGFLCPVGIGLCRPRTGGCLPGLGSGGGSASRSGGGLLGGSVCRSGGRPGGVGHVVQGRGAGLCDVLQGGGVLRLRVLQGPLGGGLAGLGSLLASGGVGLTQGCCVLAGFGGSSTAGSFLLQCVDALPGSGQQLVGGDAGHTVPHEAAERLVQPGVSDLARRDAGGACRAGDLGKAEVVDQLGAGDGGGRGCAGCRALQHLQAGGSGTGIIAYDDTVDAGERRVGQRHGQGVGLPLGDGVASEAAGVHPATARPHGDLQPACGCHREVLISAEHTRGEARKVGRHVCGIEVVAVGGIKYNFTQKIISLQLAPDRSAQPHGAGGAVALALGDDIGHPDGGLVAQLRDGAVGHIPRGKALGIDGQLNAAGAELFQQFVGAPGHEPLEVGLALVGLALFLVRLYVPGIDVKLPPVSTGGIRQAHGDGGPVLALACALHHSNVGVVAVAKGPRGPLKVAPLGGKTVVWVSGGPVDLEQQLLVCVLACQPHPEAQVAGRADGRQVVHDTAAGGLCSVGGVKAHKRAQL